MIVAFEGPDGCGKTSLIDAIIQQNKYPLLSVVKIHEPQGWQRDLLNKHKELNLTKQTKLMLYLSSMVEQQPSSPEFSLSGASRTLYLYDRSILSTLVYQVLIGDVISIGTFCDLVLELKLKLPAIIFLLRVKPETLVKRVQDRSQDDPGGFGTIDPKYLVDIYEQAKNIFPILFRQTQVVEIDSEGTIADTAELVHTHLKMALVKRDLITHC